ncbi:MAG: hypothetical protein ACYTG0_29210 [Planctomycetota bacterium]|jgi:hypothetical protein
MDHEPEHTDEEQSRARANARPFQFGIGTLFVLTTVFAVASAGYAKGSTAGAIGALLGAWITVVGFACIWWSVVARSQTRLFALAMGIAYSCLGAALWMAAVL